MQSNIVDELKKKLPSLEEIAGSALITKSSSEFAAPCPGDCAGGEDRFFWEKGKETGYCRQCEKSYSTLDIYMIRNGLTIKDLPVILKDFGLQTESNSKKYPKKEKKPKPNKNKKSSAWSLSEKNDSRLTKYFANRGINFTEEFPQPPALKFSTWKDKDTKEDVISILAAVTNINTDKKVEATHRTYLTDNLKVSNRIMKGDIKNAGRGVWMHRKRATIENRLIIGEGIETVLSAMQATGITGVSGLDSGKLKSVDLPPNIEELFILVDEDVLKKGAKTGYAGQKVSLALAKQYEAKDIKCWLITPSDTCFTDNPVKKDFNDLSIPEIIARFAKKQNLSEIEWSPPESSIAKINQKNRMSEMLARFVYMRDGNKMIDLEKPPQFAIMEKSEFITAFRTWGYVPREDDQQGNPMLYTSAFFAQEGRKAVVGERYFPGKPVVFEHEGVNWFNSMNLPKFEYTKDRGEIQLILEHLDYLFPTGQIERFNDWLAWTIMEPQTRIKFTPLLIAKHQRTGRGYLVELIRRLLGGWNCTTVEMQVLAGQSSDGQYHNYMYNSLFCALHEVKVEAADAYAVDDAIRSKLTEPVQYLNLKYGKNGTMPIFTNFLMMTNHRKGLAVDDNDMRIEVFEHFSESRVSKEDALLPIEEQSTYYNDLYQLLENHTAMCQFWSHLKDWYEADVNNFNPMGSARMSAAKMRLIGGVKNDTEHIFDEAMKLAKTEVVSVRIVKDLMFEYMVSEEHMDMSEIDANDLLEEKTRHISVMISKKFVQLYGGRKIKVDGISSRFYAIKNETYWTEDIKDKDRRDSIKNEVANGNDVATEKYNPFENQF